MLREFKYIVLGLAFLGLLACEKNETYDPDILYTNLEPDIISTSLLSLDYLNTRPPIKYIEYTCPGYYDPSMQTQL